MNKGKLVISLDFELLWGVRDKRTIESYGDSLKQVHSIVPRMIDLFDKYGVKATFATVGFLFAKTKQELLNYFPRSTPNYLDQNLSPYGAPMNLVKEHSNQDPFHFAPKLIDILMDNDNHEIGSHTFSHFYCLEEGQSLEDFEGDLKAAIEISASAGNRIRSIVFPRNQVNADYLKVCLDNGISSYRGTERVWFNKAESESDTTLLKKIFRTLDCYINISGHHTFSLNELVGSAPYNIRSSRFLRPYNTKVWFLEFMKLRRIKKSMTHAAKKGEVYHLWWHPHNFGANTEMNFAILDNILAHHARLVEKYEFGSATMQSIVHEIERNNMLNSSHQKA
ncbi:MAG: polysaccharide deacetylase family protein [Bacteroidota bacterium]